MTEQEFDNLEWQFSSGTSNFPLNPHSLKSFWINVACTLSSENAQPPAFPVLADSISSASISSETPESSKNMFFVEIASRLSSEVPNSNDLGIFTPISLI